MLKKILLSCLLFAILGVGIYLAAQGGGEEIESPEPCYVVVHGNQLYQQGIFVGCITPGNDCIISVQVPCPDPS